MTKYVAFLGAVNVGGRVVKMDVLKKIFAIPGFHNISTYIQSGNVIFEHAEKNKALIRTEIETALRGGLTYEVKVLLRTVQELANIVQNNPFKDHPDEMGLHVTFLSQLLEDAKIQAIIPLQTNNEQFSFLGEDMYLLCRKGGYSDSIFSNKFIEKKLGVYATTRNWNTVTKLAGV